MAAKKINRELSIFINDREVINSLGGVTREITRVNAEMRNLNRNSASYDEDLIRLRGTLGDLRDSQSSFREEIRATNDEMGAASEAFGKIFTGLSTGNLPLAQEGFQGLRGAIMGTVRASLAFIATPIGAAIAVFVGLIATTKLIFDFNKGLEESNRLLGSLGVNAGDLSKVRSEIEATAETFDKEFGDLAEKVNSLSKTYGISMSEANAIITQGLANGGAQNNEFLDSLGEYDEFFVNAGYSAQEFVGIINKGFDLGIYADKLPDALKEADLALKEQTKSTKDALVNAFGAAFSDEILGKVRTGEITTKDALEAIAAKSKETQLSQQQQAQLTADVFKGAGEDAGGALKILEVVGQTAKKELSETAKASLELVKANERLNKAQSDLFEIEGFSGIWDVIKASAIDALASSIEYIKDLKNNIQPLINLVGVVFVGAWYVLKNVIAISVGLFGDFLKGISAGLGLVSKGFTLFTDAVIFQVKSIITNIAPLLEVLGVNVEKLQKKLEGFKSKEVNLKVNTTDKGVAKSNVVVQNQVELDNIAAAKDAARQKEDAARQKSVDKKKADDVKNAKEELDRVNALAKAKTDVTKAELNLFIASNRSKVDNTKALSPEIIAEETSRLERLKQKQLEALETERTNKIAKAEQESKSKEESDAIKQAADLEYQTAKQNLEFEFYQSTDALKKTYDSEQKELALEQMLIDKELELAQADTKAQEDAIRQDQSYKKEIDGYKKLLADKKITQEEYNRFEAAAKVKQEEMNRVRELQQLQGTLGGLNQLAGALGEMFGQSKELAIVQAGINGAMAVTSILAQYPKFDGGFAMTAAIVAAGISTVAQIGKIAGAKAPKTRKFYDGGYTGNQASLGYDEYGAVTGYVHKNEWVAPESMTQSPRYAATFSWLEGERKNKLKGYFEGGSTSSTSLAAPVPGMEQEKQNNELLQAVLFHLQNPKSPTLLFGYKEAQSVNDLNTETQNSKNNGIVS